MHTASCFHVNHLGFRPDDPLKRAIMPVNPGEIGWLGGDVANIIEVSRLVRFPLGSPEWLAAQHPHFMTREQTPLGEYLVCDFSDLTEFGGYQLHLGDRRSYPFVIYRDAWKRCFRLLLEWYRIASCGEAVPGYHDLCHLDDCRMADTGEQRDLVGGWHDAGDLRKWTSTMSTVTLALTELVEEHPDRLETLGLDPGLVWHQLERGAVYLLKMIDPATGEVWHSIASDVTGSNESGVWTDNIPNSGDERGAVRNVFPSTMNKHIQTLASLARVFRERDPERARTLVDAAVQVMHALQTRLDRENTPEDLIDAATQLWRTTGEEDWQQLAVDGLRILLDRQVTDARFGQDRIRGYFLRDGVIDYNYHFRGRGGRNLFHYAAHAGRLARALLLWPAHPDASRWRDGLTLLLEGCLEPMIALSPFRALPACLCAENDPAPGARPLAGGLSFRYFGIEAEGNNGELAKTGKYLALAARALGQPRWAACGQKQVEWVLGFNPADCCMMTGLGYSTAAVFSPFVGQIPGAIINGFLGTRDDDQPLLNLDRQLSPMLMEYWSVHTAALLSALAVLENETLS